MFVGCGRVFVGYGKMLVRCGKVLCWKGVVMLCGELLNLERSIYPDTRKGDAGADSSRWLCVLLR